jgi:hypothetical protein
VIMTADFDQGDTPNPDAVPGYEQRLARVEQQLAAQTGASAKSPVHRALKFLPLLAVSNFLIAVPAFLLSVAVAYFTFVGAEATEKMQIASVWPHISFESSNQSAEGSPLIRLSLTNKGVGPATIKGMEIRYRDRAYTGFRDILGACCSHAPQQLSLGMASIVGEVLRPGDDLMFAQIDPSKVPADVWTRFDKERLNLKVRVCYCSVFDDCWISNGSDSKTQVVKECPVDWTQFHGPPQLNDEN